MAAVTGSGGAGVKVVGLRCEAAGLGCEVVAVRVTGLRCEVAVVNVAGSRCEAVVIDVVAATGFVMDAKVTVLAVVAGLRCMWL